MDNGLKLKTNYVEEVCFRTEMRNVKDVDFGALKGMCFRTEMRNVKDVAFSALQKMCIRTEMWNVNFRHFAFSTFKLDRYILTLGYWQCSFTKHNSERSFTA